MNRPLESPTNVRFGPFEVNFAAGEVRKYGVRTRMQDQPLLVLQALVERPGEIVTREDLIRRLWPDGTNVDFDRGLNAAVTRLRQTLSDSADVPRYVETLPRRGYRFLAPVEITGGGVEEEAVTPAAASQSTVPPPPTLRDSGGKFKWVAGGGLLAAGVVIAAVASFRPAANLDVKLEQITRDSGLATDPSFSPDGNLLAYASDRGDRNLHIWVKQVVDDGGTIQLTRGEWDDTQPSFSPDGSRLAYRSGRDGGGIYVIPAIGGDPVRLAEQGRNPRFSPDGKWIAYWVGGLSGSEPICDASGKIFVIPAAGGPPRRLGESLPGAGFPVWSSDSKNLLVYANFRGTASAENADWWVVPADGGPPAKTGAFAALESQGFSLPFASGQPRASVWEKDTLLFSGQKDDSRNVWRIRFPADANAPSGMAERITQGTTFEVQASSNGANAWAFASLTQRLSIWALPLDSNARKVIGELQKLTDGDLGEVTPSISADGRYMVYGTTVPGKEDIWLKDLQDGRLTALARTTAGEWHPILSGDGSQVVYTARGQGYEGQYLVPRTGGAPRKIGTGGGWFFDWTPDGTSVLFSNKRGVDHKLERLHLSSGTRSVFIFNPNAGVYQTKFSPDRKWLGFETVRGPGNSQVHVVRLQDGKVPPDAAWIQISDKHGWADKPRWSPDGNAIYYISDRDGSWCIWAQALDPETKHPSGPVASVQHFHRSRLSPMNVGLALLEMDVAKDKLVIGLGELTGNIWKASRSQ